MICIKTLARTRVLFNPAKHDTRQDLAHPAAAKDGPGMQKPIKKGLYSATSVYFQEGVQVASSRSVHKNKVDGHKPLPAQPDQANPREIIIQKGGSG